MTRGRNRECTRSPKRRDDGRGKNSDPFTVEDRNSKALDIAEEWAGMANQVGGRPFPTSPQGRRLPGDLLNLVATCP